MARIPQNYNPARRQKHNNLVRINKTLSETQGPDYLANKRGQTLQISHIPSGRFTIFKAYITDFADGYAPEWEEDKVVGRMDPLQKYSTTPRVITIAWNVIADSVEEAQQNLQKSSLLLSMLYPAYDQDGESATVIEESPLCRLKFMNLIQNSKTGEGLLGRFSGFQYKPNLDGGVFDPLGTGIDGENELYPQEISFNCQFSVLHEHNLGFNKYNKNPRKSFKLFPYRQQLEDINSNRNIERDQQTSKSDRTNQLRANQLSRKG